ncbi:hypothetical protein HanPI659440_Chr09g0316621 [Helianthus annuus]|nr:hypothetical protein HanPI659440_Chr09g0316621 [Helianthus annuus]
MFMKCRYILMPEDDQAQRRTEHDKDTCFRKLSPFYISNDEFNYTKLFYFQV